VSAGAHGVIFFFCISLKFGLEFGIAFAAHRWCSQLPLPIKCVILVLKMPATDGLSLHFATDESCNRA
jgi:hypothetical protein